jgi:hypothetical protein
MTIQYDLVFVIEADIKLANLCESALRSMGSAVETFLDGRAVIKDWQLYLLQD